MSPIHRVKFLIGIYMIGCPKDKILIFRVHIVSTSFFNLLNDYFIFVTLHCLFSNDKFDLVYR